MATTERGKTVAALRPAEHIDACATCGYQAWREGYPCNRCGGVESIRYVPDMQLRRVVEAERERIIGLIEIAAERLDHAGLPDMAEGMWGLARTIRYDSRTSPRTLQSLRTEGEDR